MIRFVCPECGEKLKASDALEGRRGRCPECGQGVPVPREPTAFEMGGPPKPVEDLPAIALSDDDEDLPTPVAVPDTPERGLSLEVPEVLGRNNHYLICNSKDVVATWEDDGKGWMVHVKDGFVKASTNPAQLPSMGNYIFIEIVIGSEGGQKKLSAVRPFTLPGAYALSRLAKHDNAILETIEGTAELNARQTALVRQRINAKFLPNIWDNTEGIL